MDPQIESRITVLGLRSELNWPMDSEKIREIRKILMLIGENPWPEDPDSAGDDQSNETPGKKKQ